VIELNHQLHIVTDHAPAVPVEGPSVDAPLVEIVEERDAQAYGFTIKSRANGYLHRVLPVRDPNQPRFWCVVVFRCTPGGLPEASERPWIGPGGLKREDLKEIMGAIRADPAAWLADAAHVKLRDWVLAPGEIPAPASGRTTALASPNSTKKAPA
jgi:hypothetical protein